MAEAAAIAAEAALPQEQRNFRQCLAWIGFTAVHRQRICSESFKTFDDIFLLTEKDIRNLKESFAKRTPAAQRIVFGQRKTKLLCAFTHWIKDFRRVDTMPTIAGLNQDSFRAVLRVAARRDEIRKEEIEKSAAVLK